MSSLKLPAVFLQLFLFSYLHICFIWVIKRVIIIYTSYPGVYSSEVKYSPTLGCVPFVGAVLVVWDMSLLHWVHSSSVLAWLQCQKRFATMAQFLTFPLLLETLFRYVETTL